MFNCIFVVELLSYDKHSKQISDSGTNWKLGIHLTSIQEMLPYFVAAGHYFYAKSAYVYLSMMFKLELDHPEAYRHFKAGHHVLRRTDRFLGGLWTDLTIEQILMRSVKSSGGLTEAEVLVKLNVHNG